MRPSLMCPEVSSDQLTEFILMGVPALFTMVS